MPNAYQDCSPEELLEALEQAGRHPDLDLLRACLEQQEAITPGLLTLFASDLDQDILEQEQEWEDEDPRWYRAIHAGFLLLAFREPAALPTFAAYFRDQRYENYLEWFEGETLAYYGPAAVPVMLDLLQDEAAWIWGRILASGVLGSIAANHPDTRERILPALRAQLPSLREDGTPDVPGELINSHDFFWTHIAYDLARLKDRVSEPTITALFEHDLLDEMIFGGLEDYQQILASDKERDRFPEPSFDLLDSYKQRQRWEAKRESEASILPKIAEYKQKIGRNERVTIRNPDTGETQTRKYKHAQKLLDQGWILDKR
jgi:hypothetical protein